MRYVVIASVTITDEWGWRTTRQVPTFLVYACSKTNAETIALDVVSSAQGNTRATYSVDVALDEGALAEAVASEPTTRRILAEARALGYGV